MQSTFECIVALFTPSVSHTTGTCIWVERLKKGTVWDVEHFKTTDYVIGWMDGRLAFFFLVHCCLCLCINSGFLFGK